MIAGQQLTATLRLVQPLGQGAMGSVWVADHLALCTQVAVKFMAPAYAQDAEMVARFRREAMAAAQIKHHHVAQVFDHGITIEGAPFIVMELLEGETLKSRIRRLGPLPLAEVTHIVRQAAKALGRAHQLGIVHRDIKPDNLFLLDVDGELFVKVLDFGVAKLPLGSNLGATTTGTVFGTPLYMAPEQLLSSKHVDFRADLWALGVVACFALTGKHPFTGETIGALAVAVNSGVFRPPSEHRPGLPPGVDAWMTRALQRDSAARFGSAKEMAEALEQAAGMPRGPMASGWDAGTAASPAALHSAEAEVVTVKLADSAPGARLLSGSGANARTLQGIAATGARGGRRRAPFVIGGILLFSLFALGAGLLVTMRGNAEQEEAEETLPASSAAAAPDTSTAMQEPPTSTGSDARSISPPGPAAGTSTVAAAVSSTIPTATASTSATQKQQPVPGGATGAMTAKALPSAAKPPKKPDDIGF